MWVTIDFIAGMCMCHGHYGFALFIINAGGVRETTETRQTLEGPAGRGARDASQNWSFEPDRRAAVTIPIFGPNFSDYREKIDMSSQRNGTVPMSIC